MYAEQHNVLLTVFTASLAEGLLKTGQLEEALLTINGAINRATSFGSTFDMAELLRLKAEALANMPQGDREAATDLLKQAIRSARTIRPSLRIAFCHELTLREWPAG